jgi:hypothetical protein
VMDPSASGGNEQYTDLFHVDDFLHGLVHVFRNEDEIACEASQKQQDTRRNQGTAIEPSRPLSAFSLLPALFGERCGVGKVTRKPDALNRPPNYVSERFLDLEVGVRRRGSHNCLLFLRFLCQRKRSNSPNSFEIDAITRRMGSHRAPQGFNRIRTTARSDSEQLERPQREDPVARGVTGF